MKNKSQPSRILITGANGFIGQALCNRLVADGYEVVGTVRDPSSVVVPCVHKAITGDIQSFKNLDTLLDGVSAVFHLAARVHVLKDRAKDPLAVCRSTNVEGTHKLLRACIAGGVRRFIYLSTVKVHGEGRQKAYIETDVLLPQDPYAISKKEAEQLVCSIGMYSDMDTIIIRPPLVYGPNVKANFFKLIRMAQLGVPLPLASVDNKRSLIFLDNIVDFLVTCLSHDRAANNTFLISDGNDIATSDLYIKISNALGKKARIFTFPQSLLFFLGRLTGKRAAINRLCGNLTVDTTKAKEMLGWQPIATIDHGIQKTIDWYLMNNKS